MPPEPVIVWVVAWQEGGITHHRYYDRPGPAEAQAAGVEARLPGNKPLVYAQTVYPDLEEKSA
jgi:hypothetical protein